MLHVLGTERELLAPSRRRQVCPCQLTLLFGDIPGKKKKSCVCGRDCDDLNYSLGYWSSDVTLFQVTNCNAACLQRTGRCSFLISPLFPASPSCRFPVQPACRGQVNRQLQHKEEIIAVSHLHYPVTSSLLYIFYYLLYFGGSGKFQADLKTFAETVKKL